MWCRQRPKRTDTKKLRELFLQVTSIHTLEAKKHFLARFNSWEKQYGQKIALKQESGWVFSDLVRSRSMLLKALPNMFQYLKYPGIPKTTNGLEGYFSRLKRHYRNHRGLTNLKLNNYFDWYFYLSPK